MKLTEQQIAYIIAHKNDQPRKKVAEAVGVSTETVQRIALKNGGKTLNNKLEHLEDLVRRHYPTMTAREIAEKFGYKKGTVDKVARRLNIQHTPETKERIKTARNEKLVKIARDTDEQRRKTWRTRRKLDQMRLWEGKPQRTRHQFAELPTRTYKSKWFLIKQHGYIPVEDSPYLLRYDSRTRRCSRAAYPEAYYETRYHLRFEPAKEATESEPQDRQAV